MKKDTLGYRLKVCRKKNNLTQEQLAGLLGVKQNTICTIEKGIIKTPSFGKEMAKILKVDPGWLMYGRGTGTPPPYFDELYALKKKHS